MAIWFYSRGSHRESETRSLLPHNPSSTQGTAHLICRVARIGKYETLLLENVFCGAHPAIAAAKADFAKHSARHQFRLLSSGSIPSSERLLPSKSLFSNFVGRSSAGS